MKLRNTTNIPDELVREIVRFVKPNGVSCDVMVKNIGSGGHAAGTSYHAGSGYHMTADPFVVCRIGGEYPWVWKSPGPGYLDLGWIGSRIEALVALMAHELRHQWQKNHKRGRVWGSRGRFSERDADAYALRMLRKWRNRNG